MTMSLSVYLGDVINMQFAKVHKTTVFFFHCFCFFVSAAYFAEEISHARVH